MNDIIKGMFLAFAIVYFFSPIDGCPGPIDDILLLILAASVNRGKKNGKKYLD